MTAPEALHRLVDRLHESEVPTTRKLLRALIDPLELAILTAAEDEEPESDAEREAVREALADTRQGRLRRQLAVCHSGAGKLLRSDPRIPSGGPGASASILPAR